jgi:hypothetical protein
MPRGVHEQHAIGAAHGMTKLTVEQARAIKIAWRDCPKEYLHGLVSLLAEKYHVSIGPIQKIVNDETWRHVTISDKVEQLDRKLLEEIQERRKKNALNRRSARHYLRGIKNESSDNRSLGCSSGE